MPISEKDVRHLAKLAQLHLDDAEVARMARELDTIVAYVDQLRAVDTAGVEAIANVAGLVDITRPDEPGAMFAIEQALANAPQRNASAFLVPKVVER